MSKKLTDHYDDLDDNDVPSRILFSSRQSKIERERKNREKTAEDRQLIQSQDNARQSFQFTYRAARFETWWLLDSLNELFSEHWITDVLRQVKGGKEASVYQCSSGAEINSAFATAKVYRPRSLRNLRNDHLYRDNRPDLDGYGRVILDDRMARAIQRKTEYGRTLQHQSWIAHEFTTMQQLHAAGVDVAKPYCMTANTILMEYIGEEQAASPALNEVSLERAEARRLFDRVLTNISLMLDLGRIHGDLSAYNILYRNGRITLIDFPQTISPRTNKKAYKIFARDVERVCDYFRRQGVGSEPVRLAEEIWTSKGLALPHAVPEPLE